MTEFKCDMCDYITADKSNYNKHIKSLKHLQNIETIVQNPDDNIVMCEKCGKKFLYMSGYYKHKNGNCAVANNLIAEENIKLKLELEMCKQLNTELKSYITATKEQSTYKISVKNYVQQNYPDAPALEAIEDYTMLRYDENNRNDEDDNDDNQDDEDYELINMITYNYNHSCLHKYLGNFIIKYYKKEDPSEQSLWSSDISRLTYIIKELLYNKKSIWNHDYKGTKTKDYVINPLLKYIKKYIESYWITHIDDCKKLKAGELREFNIMYNTMHKIKKDIENDILASNIVRYIAPYFCMHNKDYIEEITNEDKSCFIDEI